MATYIFYTIYLDLSELKNGNNIFTFYFLKPLVKVLGKKIYFCAFVIKICKWIF